MRNFATRGAALCLALTLSATALAQTATPDEAAVEQAMRRATEFMVEKVSTNGGYVWSYLPDFSRRWGEMEAKNTMIWVQPPGTATMGHVFLDAYHATGDEYYYQAAEKVAGALIWGQHPSGGWNYLIDFGGEASARDWYETVGRAGWRLEEFHHYYGNATFDDDGTSEASQFLLRLYVEKLDPKYRPAVEKAIDFVLDSQYPIGGWPQRYPLSHEHVSNGKPDYTAYITLNDDVAAENIKFLVMCWQVLGEERVKDAITRAMNAFLVLQQGDPQPGFALQYTLDLKPAGARSYEPLALTTHTTGAAIEQLMTFYELTGDTKFLARIPEALDWLESVKAPPELVKDGREYPTFIEIGTNRPLYLHRRGSNVENGEYYVNDDPTNLVVHYSSFRKIDVPGLRKRLEDLKAKPREELLKASPLMAKDAVPLPRYFSLGEISVSDLNVDTVGQTDGAPSGEEIAALVSGLNAEGYWPTPLKAMSKPYKGVGPKEIAPGNFATTRVGDDYDTSPYIDENPVTGISTGTYIDNMSTLIRSLADEES